MFRTTVFPFRLPWMVAVLALALMATVAAPPAGAQEGGPDVIDSTTCGHFETQADAQAALDAGTLEHPEFLDSDSDGVACEDAFDTEESEGGPVAVDPTSCGHFETQADAQAALESGDLPHPEYLDGDGDGIACEIRWGEAEPTGDSGDTGASVVALPTTGTGTAASLRVGGTIAASLASGGVIATLSLRALDI